MKSTFERTTPGPSPSGTRTRGVGAKGSHRRSWYRPSDCGSALSCSFPCRPQHGSEISSQRSATA